MGGADELWSELRSKALAMGARELGQEELRVMRETAERRLGAYQGEARRGSKLTIVIPPEKRLSVADGELSWRLMGSGASAELSWGETGWELGSVEPLEVPSSSFDPAATAPIAARATLVSAAAQELQRALFRDEDEGLRLLGWIRSGLLGADAPIVDEQFERASERMGKRISGASALWSVASLGRGERFARALMSLGADPNARGPGGESPFMALARGCREGDDHRAALAAALLEGGADPLGMGAEATERIEALALEPDQPAASLLAGARRAAWERRALMEAAPGARGSAARAGL